MNISYLVILSLNHATSIIILFSSYFYSRLLRLRLSKLLEEKDIKSFDIECDDVELLDDNIIIVDQITIISREKVTIIRSRDNRSRVDKLSIDERNDCERDD